MLYKEGYKNVNITSLHVSSFNATILKISIISKTHFNTTDTEMAAKAILLFVSGLVDSCHCIKKKSANE